MSITKEKKKKLISKFAINENDTGSPEVQIAVLSERITTVKPTSWHCYASSFLLTQ